jgi:hypothetical protein
MLQQFIIAILVLGAACYVIWTFMSMSRRQWLLDVLARRGIAARVAAAHRARLNAPGCGNCSAGEQVREPVREQARQRHRPT